MFFFLLYAKFVLMVNIGRWVLLFGVIWSVVFIIIVLYIMLLFLVQVCVGRPIGGLWDLP